MKRGFIFPSIMSFRIGDQSDSNKEFTISKDIYSLYINNHAPDELLRIIMKWQNGLELTNDEYEHIIQGSFCTSNTRKTNSNDILGGFGIDLKMNDGVPEYSINEEHLETIKSETYDYIFLNMFKDGIDLVSSECFSKPRYLGVYRTATDTREYRIDLACRSAYKFAQFDYLYNKNSDEDFVDYFIDGLHKRFNFIKLLTEQVVDEDKIKYIPIYENFKNYDKNKLNDIKNDLKHVIEGSTISIDDKEDILESLVSQVHSIDDINDSENSQILDELLKPLTVVSIEKEGAQKTYSSAEVLFERTDDYKSVVNRCFYSSLYSARAVLAKNNLLNDWSTGTMSPDEKHPTIDRKLRNYMRNQTALYSDFYQDFTYIKQQRWIADYSHEKTEKSVALECLIKSEKLLNAISNLS